MINNTPGEYVFIRICIISLGAIAPLSVVCTVYTLLHPWLADQLSHNVLPTIPLPLVIYCAIEALFLLAFQLPLYALLQAEATHPPLLPEHDRRRLFERVTRNVDADELERHLRWWCRGAELNDIGREGIKDWLSWAFFEGRLDSGSGRGCEDELEEYTAHLEKLLDRTFAPGYGKARPIRLTLDKVSLSGYRSLTWYCCVGFVDLLTYCRLCRNGYHHHRLPLKSSFTLFPFRSVSLTARKRSPVKHLTYWHRPHTAQNRLPVLFIHGIGIGLYPYVNFLDDLIHHVDDGQPLSSRGQIGVIALEIMPVSFRVTHSALGKDEMCAEIDKILAHHGWDKCVLVAHSYGTITATHMLHDTMRLQRKIAHVLLIDPVCFLLHNPDVAYNFTVRAPTHANEWQLWYFASQDPGVAHTLCRRFFWSQNVLWLDELVPLMARSRMKVTVSLAGRDLIVDTRAVGRYLVSGTGTGTGERHQAGDTDEWKHKEWKGEGLEVIWNQDRDHAQVFDSAAKRARLVAVVRKYCEVEPAIRPI